MGEVIYAASIFLFGMASGLLIASAMARRTRLQAARILNIESRP